MEYVARHKDHGLAWMVCAVTFLLHMCVDGIVFSLGVLYVDLAEQFEAQRALISWISAVNTFMMHVVAILAGSLTSYFGFRKVALVGSFISTAGLALTFVGSNVTHLLILIGIVTGSGFGLLYFASYLSLQLCFDRRLALAMGLSTSGTGVGTFVFAPLLEWLIVQYTWRGALLLTAGVVAQCAVLSCLLGFNFKHEKGVMLETNPANNIDEVNRQTNKPKPHSKSPVSAHETDGQQILSVSNVQLEGNWSPDRNAAATDIHCSNLSENLFTEVENRPFELDQETYEQRDGQQMEGMGSPPAADDTPTRHQSRTKCCAVLADVIDLSALRCKSLDLILLCVFFLQIGFVVPFVFLPDRAVQAGISRSRSALLVSIMAAANSVSRILLGFIADYIPRHRSFLLAAIIYIGAAINISSVVFNNFTGFALYSAVQGICLGTLASLTPVLLRDCVPAQHVTKSIGLLFLTVAISSLWNAPLAGWLYDVTQSYDMSFIITGVSLALGATGLMIVPFVANIMKCCCVKTKGQLSLS